MPSQPRIVYGRQAQATTAVSARQAGLAMAQLGIPPELINKTIVYVQGGNHFFTNGMTNPRALARMFYWGMSELRSAPGPVLQINVRVRGKFRSAADINRTLVHELEHVAQWGLKPWWLWLSHFLLAGFVLGGAIGGVLLSQGQALPTRMVATVAGALIGYEAGYKLAPHELLARSRAARIECRAVSTTEAG